ncbi:MAG: hypothetical protein LBT46_12720 [Planctomycetaceae bacterium]|nr:hypothetical protein [Planctomycetaceae bacterium]
MGFAPYYGELVIFTDHPGKITNEKERCATLIEGVRFFFKGMTEPTKFLLHLNCLVC